MGCAAASHSEAIRQRLEAESPFFQRLQLEPLLQLHNVCAALKANIPEVSCSWLRGPAALDRRDCALALTGFDSGSPSLGQMVLKRTACAGMVRSPCSSAPTTSMQGRLSGLSLRFALSRSS